MAVFFFKPTLSSRFSPITTLTHQLSYLLISKSSISTYFKLNQNAYLDQTPHFSDRLLSLLEHSSKGLFWVSSIHSQVIVNALQTDQYLAAKLVKAYVDLGHLGLARNVFDQFSRPEVFLCNAMMNGYTKHEQYNKILELFRIMDFSGLEIDDCTFTFVIKACTALSDYEFGMGIVNWVLECGFSGNWFLGSSMINFLVKFDYVDEARRLFDEMRRKDVVCWNSMIGGYVKGCRFEEAVDLFIDMRGFNIKPSSVTLVSLIQACEGIGSLNLGRCVHGCVLGLGMGDDLMVLTSLVCMYSKMGDFGSSCSVFDRMDIKSSASWGVMISAYVRNGFVHDAFNLFRRLVYSGTDFDSGTIVSLLQGCSQTADLKSGKILHGRILRRGHSLNTILSTALLDLYSKCGALRPAYYIFTHMEDKNVVTWTALLVGLVQNGHAEDAFRLFHQMKEEGVAANSITLVSLIHSCAHLGSFKEGKSVHAHLLRHGFALDDVKMTALVDMYAKCGNINYAERVFSNGAMYRDVVLWNSMVTAYGIHGHGRQAMNVYYRMIDEGVEPNQTTFLALLAACSHSGLVEEGTSLFEKMKRDHKIMPLEKHYACVVDLLSRAGRLDDAEAFIKKMPSQPGSDVLEALLNGCRFHRNINIAVKTADKLLCLDSMDPGLYVILSNLYAEVKRWDAVDYIRDLMRSKGLKKTPGFSSKLN